MSDDNQQNHDHDEHHESSSGATAASNQNLIVGLVLGAAILLLLFLVFNSQNGGSKKSSGSGEVADLKNQISELTRDLESAAGRSDNFGNSGSNYGIDPQKLAEEIATEANALAGAIAGFGDTIRQKEALLQSAKDTEQLLNRRIAELQRQLNELGETARKSLVLQQELDSTKILLDAANRQIEELRKRPDAGVLEQLRAENENLRSRLASEAELQAENRDLREEVRRLRAIVDRATLFVDDVNVLPAVAQELYRKLERLEGIDPGALNQQYGLITDQLKARPLRSITFATGSSQIDNKQIGTVRNDVAAAESDAFLLVVGYASNTGDFETNRKLSSARATAVASQVNLIKSSGQEVRAVFLNETNRFSTTTPELNQICEIWEIRP